MLQKVEDLINKTKIYTSSISTDNGIVFKNNEGFTNLTANVIDNGVDRTDNFTIRWFKDGNHIYAGRTIKVRALDVESKAVYKFEARDTEGILRGFEEVTVMDVSDGTDGEDAAIKSDTPPDDKTKLWYDTVNNVFKYWDGEKWVEAYAEDIEDAKDAAGNAQESANTAISSVTNINTSFEKYKNEVRAEFKNTVEYVNGKTEVVDTWVRQGSDGVTPFLELGGTGNDLKARLTNSRLGFYQGDKGLAYFGNEKAYMPVAEIDNLSAKRVGVGNYAMLDNGDGHLSIIYIE